MKRDFSKLDRLLEEFASHSVPGCTCTIMQGDKAIYEGAAGYADIASGKKVNAHSMFRQASTTKLFTYAILGMLYEEGRFLFSEPVGKYLPEWSETKKFVVRPNGEVDTVPTERPLTIQNAVAMMCGLPYCMAPAPNPTTPTLAAMSKRIAALLEKGTPTLREEVRAMGDVPVMFEPGSHWEYGFGSEITGALVETLTGKALRENFREKIIEPLGLEDTDTFFTYKGKKFLGAGTVAMLHANQLGEAQMKDFTNDYLAGYGYGYGFRTLLTQEYGHNGHIGCFGWTGGSGIWVEADPVDKFSIAYMHNMMPNEELYHHHRVRATAYGIML